MGNQRPSDRASKPGGHSMRQGDADGCRLVREYRTTRSKLQHFAAEAVNIDLARAHTPYHRANAGNKHQLEFLEQLRKRYVAIKHDLNRELIVRKYKLPKVFKFKPSHDLRRPVLVGGVYRPDEANVVDFANKNIGGGFLTYGMAQEEVMMCERTDFGFFIAQLYAEKKHLTIDQDEALVIDGADFCAGLDFYGKVPELWYAQSCFFHKPRRNETSIIAVDCIRPRFKKYQRGDLEWCIKKAYCGFQGVEGGEITTGPWGCGAFFNNHNTMFCIQSLAGWLAHKKLFYHSSYPRITKGYNMVISWGENRTSFDDAFDELIRACATDPDFETTYDPDRVPEDFPEVKLTGNLDVTVSDGRTPGVLELKDFMEYATAKWPAMKLEGSSNASPDATNRTRRQGGRKGNNSPRSVPTGRKDGMERRKGGGKGSRLPQPV